MATPNKLAPISERSSLAISMVRFPFIVLVVLSHCVLIREVTHASLELTGENLYLLTEVFFWGITYAVSGFALISGYFMMSQASFGWANYAKAMKKRFSSLIIPFVLWNIIMALALWGKNALATELNFAPGYNEIEAKLVADTPWWKLLFLPIDHPLWYLRELIYLSILSPIFYYAIRYLKFVACILIGIPYFLGYNLLDPTFGISVSLAYYFMLGMYLRQSNIDFVKLSYRLRWIALFGTLAYFAETCFIPRQEWLHRLLMHFPMALSFAGTAWIYDNRKAWMPTLVKLGDMTFFIYAAHAIIIINLVRGSLYTTPLGNSPWGSIIIFFITGISTVLSCMALYSLGRKVCPKMLSVLSGGR